MTLDRIVSVADGLSVAAALLSTAGPAALAQDLCGRPTEQSQAKDTIWTFTVPGHPAHPSVVCRRPVQDGAQLRLQMNYSAMPPNPNATSW
jgi:hypothetical protein